MPKGIVIQIQGDGSSAKAALEMVREQMRMTAEDSALASTHFGRMSSSLGEGVPKMAAASAALRALEGNFTNNIRAGERFLSMLPGMSSLLATAFPAIGVTVLATALFEMGEKAYNAIGNVVELKSALEALGQVDLVIARKLQSDQDAIESSVEQQLEATGGHVAALKQKLAYEAGKPLDLSELFYDKNFSGQEDNVKANYENLYKSVAPQDIPAKLRSIRQEITQLHGALNDINTKNTGGMVQFVRGFGPTMLEDPVAYYKARLKSAEDISKLLNGEVAKNSAAQAALNAQIAKPEKAKTAHSDNSFLENAARLQEAQSRAAADAQKVAAQVQLSEAGAQHKMILMSDQEFYAEKEKRQTEELDAEEKALTDRQKTLASLLVQQHGDKTLRRGSDGQSAEELKTQRDLVDVGRELNALTARRADVAASTITDQYEANKAADLQNLRVAASLEAERNDQVTARIKLIRYEHEEEAKKLEVNGDATGAADVRDAGELLAKKEQLAQAERDIALAQADTKRAIDEVTDRVAKGTYTQRQAEAETNRLHAQEAEALRQRIDQIDELAAAIGGDALEKAKDLHLELDKLSTPSQKQEAKFGETLAKGVESMADRMAQAALRGKLSMKDMFDGIAQEMLSLVLKIEEEKFLMPFLSGLFGGAGGGGGGSSSSLAQFTGMEQNADGTDNAGGGPQIIGERGPEVWQPPKRGGSVLSNAGLAKLASSGGGGAPKVTTNIINQTSQPVTAQQSQVSYDGDAKQFIISTILENQAQGGELSHG